MTWFFPVFFLLVLVVFVLGIWQKIRLIKRAKASVAQNDPALLTAPEIEKEIGLVLMVALLYFFLTFWEYVTQGTRSGQVALWATWWMIGVRVYMAVFAGLVLSLFGLRKLVVSKPETAFAKRYEVDAPKLKRLRDTLALFTFFLVFVTIFGLVALIALQP